ncbi:ATP-binding protein [Bradyrhizobium sp. Ec3.3]|uniref:ATP-binding protein n=1 Tax=Bradyrhizobium sp. Ec3.3 TaxID=189753 RepID=UPI00040375A5|nr:ATP-binding protein [Bradyrhizobium sp. Ec3.3]
MSDDRYLEERSEISAFIQPEHCARLEYCLQQLDILPKATRTEVEHFEPLQNRLEKLREFSAALANKIQAHDPDDPQEIEAELVAQDPPSVPVPDPEPSQSEATPADPDVDLPLTDPRIAIPKEKGVFPASFWARAEFDTFQGRKDELGKLRRFIDWCNEGGQPKPLAWTLITARHGAGKTRLVLQFFQELEARGFRYGFLDPANLTSIARWQPTRPTLIVVEHRPSLTEATTEFLRALSAKAERAPFAHVVRFIVLGDENVSLKQFKPTDGGEVAAAPYYDFAPDDRSSCSLGPLSDDALLDIALGRLGAFTVDPRRLLRAIYRTTFNRKTPQKLYPTPLLAAAMGQAIAELAESGGKVDEIVDRINEDEVISWFLRSDRSGAFIVVKSHFTSGLRWKEIDEAEVTRYENLLVLATIVRG